MSIPLSQTVLHLLSISSRFWLTFILGPITQPLPHNLFVSQFYISWDHNLNLHHYGNLKFHLLLKLFNLTVLSLHTWLGIWTELVFIIIIMYADYPIRQKNTWNIVAWCTLLSPSEYTTRYSKVAGYILWTVCKHMGLQITDKYYGHKSERVINVNSATVMLDVLVITYWTILTNWPDIVLVTYRYSHTRWFKHYHKRSWKTNQVQYLEIEISRMLKVRTNIVPVIIGALGTIKKGLDQNLQLLPGNLLAIELQKITLSALHTSFVKCWGKLLCSVVEIWTYQKTAT